MDEAVVVSGPPSDFTSPVAHGELEMTERTTTPTTPTHPATENETVTGLKSIDDFELPKTIIARLLKGVVCSLIVFHKCHAYWWIAAGWNPAPKRCEIRLFASSYSIY